jgi:nitrogen regulatory protein PII-like uncharacterized protein
MKVINIHTRQLAISRSAVWDKIKKLSSRQDPVWPYETWPRMILQPGLIAGAKGGHGSIRYTIEEIKVEEEIKFRFISPKGFNGFHIFKLEGNEISCKLTHEIRMDTSFIGSIIWTLIIKHLHDALIEDAFTKIEISFNLPHSRVKWNSWVKILRYLLK